MSALRDRPNPLLLEIPTRPWLVELSAAAGRPVTLGDVPDPVLDGIAASGFDAVWLMGMWTTGSRARSLALHHPDLRSTYDRLLPGWQPDDVGGSPYSVAAYEPPPPSGGRDGLRRLRHRLNERGIALVLDFVPNHMGIDHEWLDRRPALLMRGTADDLEHAPANWFRHVTPGGEERIFGHGRDPHFTGWSDTAQIDHRRRVTREAMTELLTDLASEADGLRCDVAMLVLEDVFRRTWGDGYSDEAGDFWSEAIPAARERFPDLTLIAEAYWGLEDRLCSLGFDWAYDKELYDRLVRGDPVEIREAMTSDRAHHARRAHFLENHDEQRAWKVFGPERSAAAAVALYTLPGLRFFQLGQADGYRERVPVQLARYPEEPARPECRKLYDTLLRCLADPALREGEWETLRFDPAEDGSAAGLVGSSWTGAGRVYLAAANLGDEPARARLRPPLAAEGPPVPVTEELSGRHFELDRKSASQDGMSVEVPGGGASLFRLPRERL